VIGYLLVVQVPDASDQRMVALTFRPIDRFPLRVKGAEHMVRMVFDDIIVDPAALGASLRTGFDVHIRHALFPQVGIPVAIQTQTNDDRSGSMHLSAHSTPGPPICNAIEPIGQFAEQPGIVDRRT
jgi:hypothetical protein